MFVSSALSALQGRKFPFDVYLIFYSKLGIPLQYLFLIMSLNTAIKVCSHYSSSSDIFLVVVVKDTYANTLDIALFVLSQLYTIVTQVFTYLHNPFYF